MVRALAVVVAVMLVAVALLVVAVSHQQDKLDRISTEMAVLRANNPNLLPR